VRYILRDNFLTFWFRFIYKYSHIIEIGAYDQLKEIVKRDYPTFSGIILERYFRERFIESRKYSRIGGYWDRKGENEIDLIAVNEFDQTADIVEIKRKASNIKPELLNAKATHLSSTIGELSDYKFNIIGLSMEDM
ncbi:MAG: DUF234 domain-containing protein, partial [Rikenellaceae bacterium]